MLKISTSGNLIFRGIAMILTVLNSIVLTNFFGLELLGIYTTFIMYIGLSGQFFSFSFNSYCVRIYPSTKENQLGEYILNSFIFQFIFFSLGIIIFKNSYPEIISLNYKVFCLILFFTFLNAIFDNLFTGIGKAKIGAILLLFRSFTIIFFVSVINFSQISSENYNTILLNSLLSSEALAFVIFFFYLMRKKIFNRRIFNLNLGFIKKGVKSGFYLTIYSFLFLLNIYLPRLILSFDNSDLITLGKYQINFLVVMALCNLLESTYSTSKLSEIVIEMEKKEKIKISEIFNEIKPYLLIMLCYAIFSGLIFDFLSKIINGVDLFSIILLSLNALLYFTYRSFYYRIYSGAYDHYLVVINIVIAVFSASSLFFLNSYFGYNGILLSTVTNSFVMIIVSIWFIKNKINVSRV